jgi:hypothetical protein
MELETSHIGTLAEGPLHESLKHAYLEPNGVVEARLLNAGNLSKLKRKLPRLLEHVNVRLVYPVSATTWIVKAGPNGGETRRKSPKKRGFEDAFAELVSLPHLLSHPRLAVEVLLTTQEELRVPAPTRRGWAVEERRLIEVLDVRVVACPEDLFGLLSSLAPEPFTTQDLADACAMPRWLAQKAAYCLRESSAVQIADKRGNAYVYTRG